MPAGLLLRELLPREHIFVPLEAESLREALGVMLKRLAASGEVADPAALEKLVGEPRLRDVVAIGDDVALPHYRTDAVEELLLSLAVLPRAVPGRDAGQAISPRLLFLVLAPPEAATLYLRTVSTLSRFLQHDQAVQQLLAARSPDDVLAVPGFADLRIQPSLTVRDVMTHHLETLPPDAPLQTATDLMTRRGLRTIPVVGEKGEVLGLVTDRDLMRELLPELPRVGGETPRPGKERPAETRSVRDIMSRSVLCISEDMGLDEVASILLNKDVDQLPVVHAGKLTGSLTRGDVIRKLFGR